MTKILTILVAAEHVDNLDDTFTITQEIIDYSYLNECSSAGFAANDTVTVRDLFYGTILPSGAMRRQPSPYMQRVPWKNL